LGHAVEVTEGIHAHALTNRPPLLAPGTGGDGFSSLAGYRLDASGEVPRGRFVPDNGGRDFFGTPLPRAKTPCLGAAELVH
jgi:hypothetical protein